MKEIDEFIATKCCFDANNTLSNKDIYTSFAELYPHVSPKVFFSRIKDKSIQFKANGIRFTKGIRLKV